MIGYLVGCWEGRFDVVWCETTTVLATIRPPGDSPPVALLGETADVHYFRGRKLTVLAYHGIGLDCRSKGVVCERRFRSHVDMLERAGYVGLTFAQAEERRAAGALPKKWVVFTFDDGLSSVLRAAPVLERAGFPATVFVPTRYVDTGERPDWPLVEQVASPDPRDMAPLSWTELRRLAELGWEIGSHTEHHPYLAVLSDEELARELAESRRRVFEEIGSCTSLAYPYGLADRRVVAAASRAGYTAACSLASVYTMDERMARPRVGVGARDGRLRLRLKLSPRSIVLRCSRAGRAAHSLRAGLSRREFVDDRLLRSRFSALDAAPTRETDASGRAPAVAQE